MVFRFVYYFWAYIIRAANQFKLSISPSCCGLTICQYSRCLCTPSVPVQSEEVYTIFILPWITFNKYIPKEYLLVRVLFGSIPVSYGLDAKHFASNRFFFLFFPTAASIVRLNEERRQKYTFHFLLKNSQRTADEIKFIGAAPIRPFIKGKKVYWHLIHTNRIEIINKQLCHI